MGAGEVKACLRGGRRRTGGWPCVRRWRFAIYVVCRRMTWYAGRGAMASRVYPELVSIFRCC
ncbi:hypothetical protein DBB31_24510 [Burkholderia multivorans]|nr:hypothetical protein DBB31_24510 [Burkholderia multivorans]